MNHESTKRGIMFYRVKIHDGGKSMYVTGKNGVLLATATGGHRVDGSPIRNGWLVRLLAPNDQQKPLVEMIVVSKREVKRYFARYERQKYDVNQMMKIWERVSLPKNEFVSGLNPPNGTTTGHRLLDFAWVFTSDSDVYTIFRNIHPPFSPCENTDTEDGLWISRKPKRLVPDNVRTEAERASLGSPRFCESAYWRLHTINRDLLRQIMYRKNLLAVYGDHVRNDLDEFQRRWKLLTIGLDPRPQRKAA
jgi:hypothetical protein